MKGQNADIVNCDQPARRMMRLPIQPKLMSSLEERQRLTHKSKIPNVTGTSFIKQYAKSQKQLQNQSTRLSDLPNLSANNACQEQKQQSTFHQAQITYQNGVVFKGTYNCSTKVKGHFKFANGFEYQGACNGNLFEGEGSLIFPSGKVMVGLWKQSHLSSPATIYYPNGEFYYGDVKDYKKHGRGELFLNERQKFVGQFRNGSITGEGTYFVDQQAVASGLWVDGQFFQASCLQSLKNIGSQQVYKEKSKLNEVRIHFKEGQLFQKASLDISFSDENESI